MPNCVLFAEDISSRDKLIFVYISCLCAISGETMVKNKTIMRKFNFSESTVKRAVNSLIHK